MSARRAFESLVAVSAILILAAGTAPAQVGKTKGKDDLKRLDLNSATLQELESLPGIGPVLGKKIVEGRPYKSVDDLSKSGLPAAEIEKIRALVTVAEPADPDAGKIDLNTADEAAFAAIPGIGPVLAKAIVAGRPYPNMDTLRRLKGLSQAKYDLLKDRVKIAHYPIVSNSTGLGKSAASKKGGMSKSAPKPGGLTVNINTATLAELDALPGIGPVKAQAIIDARPFEKPEDIMKVKGIKEVEFGKIKDMIIVK